VERLPPVSGLTEDLLWLDLRLAEALRSQREHGKSTLADEAGGSVIEEGEAEGLLRSLSSAHLALSRAGAAEPKTVARRSALPMLERAREVFGLEPEERDLLLVALSVELDERYARLMAFLNDHFKMNRPTVGLAIGVVCGADERARELLLRRLAGKGPLSSHGLVKLEGDGPLVSQSMLVPSDLWPRLVGIDANLPYPLLEDDSSRLEDLILSPELAARARAAIERAAKSAPSAIVISGPAGSGREGLAVALPRLLGKQGLRVDPARHAPPLDAVRVSREAALYDAVPILSGSDEIPAAELGAVLGRDTPVVIAVGRENAFAKLLALSARTVIEVALPRPSHGERSRIWQQALANGSAAGADLDAVAARFPFGPGRIRAVARLFRSETPAAEDERSASIEQACRRLSAIEVGALAQRLTSPYTRDDVVVSPEIRRELDLITAWSRHGHQAFDVQGPGRNLRAGPGLACLFHGPPGTGKTMAAQAVARDAGFEIYRIDLSQVVNKYIGETEKNLSKLFDAAEDSNSLLFFDEADSLFGKRSEIKDAHDRYANIEIGYLLQRLESYRGIAVLATNLRKNLDDAFLRRLQIIAEFPIPGPAERSRIWARLLPPAAERDAGVDIALLADRFAIAGGSIKNAIFTGTLLAAEANTRLGMQHLMFGLWRELKKSGRVVDAATFGEWQEQIAESVQGEDQTEAPPSP
jgi:hypothetical protein